MITELVEIFSALELQSLLPRARRTGVIEIDLSVSPAPRSYLSAAKLIGSALTVALPTQGNDCQNSQCLFFQSRIFVFDLRRPRGRRAFSRSSFGSPHAGHSKAIGVESPAMGRSGRSGRTFNPSVTRLRSLSYATRDRFAVLYAWDPNTEEKGS